MFKSFSDGNHWSWNLLENKVMRRILMKSSHSTARGTEEIRKQLAELWTSGNKSNLDETISSWDKAFK